MMKTQVTQFKKSIRQALAAVGRQLGWEYYNDICDSRWRSNATTHRRFKFALEDSTPLTEQELNIFVSNLQEFFPEFKVEAKNHIGRFGIGYVVAYLRYV